MNNLQASPTFDISGFQTDNPATSKATGAFVNARRGSIVQPGASAVGRRGSIVEVLNAAPPSITGSAISAVARGERIGALNRGRSTTDLRSPKTEVYKPLAWSPSKLLVRQPSRAAQATLHGWDRLRKAVRASCSTVLYMPCK
eukprot:6207536-Pleurochrysis_carterae.AAC.3